MPGSPLFPVNASTMASRVDALYFFLLAITVFFSLLIAGLIVFYAVKYRRRSPEAVGRQNSRRPAAGAGVVGDPVRHHDGDFRVGRQRLFRDRQPARRDAERLRRRQAVDVEVPASRRPARNQPAARARRPQRQADHDVGGRHSRSVLSRVQGKGRRHTGAIREHLVQRDQAGPLSSVLRRVLRHAPLRDDRRSRRDGSERVPGLAERRRGGGIARVGRRAAVLRTRMQHVSPPRIRRPGSGAQRALRYDHHHAVRRDDPG